MVDDSTRRRPLPPVALRRVAAADSELVHGWRSESSVRRYEPLGQLGVEELRAVLAARDARPVDPSCDGKVQWIIETADGPVGWVTIDVTSREHGLAALGYTIGKRFRQRGYASAAVCALLPIVFGETALDLWRLGTPRRDECWNDFDSPSKESRARTWMEPASTTPGTRCCAPTGCTRSTGRMPPAAKHDRCHDGESAVSTEASQASVQSVIDDVWNDGDRGAADTVIHPD